MEDQSERFGNETYGGALAKLGYIDIERTSRKTPSNVLIRSVNVHLNVSYAVSFHLYMIF
jgi:hypothetical protein